MDVIQADAPTLEKLLTLLLLRAIPEGGFADRPKTSYRTDATAWAAVVLSVLDEPELFERTARRLVRDQQPDGRVPIVPSHSAVWWPTALAATAWTGAEAFQVEKDRALHFTLNVAGTTPQKLAGDPVGHDTTLRGWSWVEGTHSWVEPTALSLLALDAARLTDHERFQEAVRLLLNRQLPHGGWNYGNPFIFGRELHPMPECTGAALTALATSVSRAEVQRSIGYLQGEVERLRTPMSLGWALLGLATWNLWPVNGNRLIDACLKRQSRYGEYGTSALCLLTMAAHRATWNDQERIPKGLS
ncbi:MAG TPA: hypothetical protein VFS39_04140 [Nitrospira sp.]|nr:hypothetical protein [Nitrospira sp.]